MLKNLAIGVLTTSMAFGITFSGTGTASATNFQEVSVSDCIAPNQIIKTDFPSRGSMPMVMVKCGENLYLKDAYQTLDKFNNPTGLWTGVYKKN